MRTKNKIFAVSLFLASLSSLAIAQNGLGDASKLKGKQIPKTILKGNAPQNNLPKPDPLAGIYKIKGIDSNLCIGKGSKGLTDAITGNLGYGMNLVSCDDIMANWALIPRPDKTYTIRSYKGYFVGGVFFGDYSTCANVARNVIIGPAAIDLNRCEKEFAAEKEVETGKPDQRFRFEKTTDGYWQIKASDNECFDARNHGKDVGTEIVKWACTGNQNQKWQLIYDNDIKDDYLRENLIKEGLY